MAILELDKQTSAGTYMMVVPAGMSAVVMYWKSIPSSVYSSRQSNFCIPLLVAHSSRRGMFRGAYSFMSMGVERRSEDEVVAVVATLSMLLMVVVGVG